MITAQRYDTFEDEKEIEKIIQSLQSKTMEYITSPNAWEFQTMPDEKYSLN
ncbi:hypothetical protein IKQ21_02325 [bacterium]|nr:hypothetical protein [bacterium]